MPIHADLMALRVANEGEGLCQSLPYYDFDAMLWAPSANSFSKVYGHGEVVDGRSTGAASSDY